MNFPWLLMRALLGRRLPLTSGTVAVPGLAHEVLIRRDGWGVPHISARTDADAWYALGFCHGQDRTFQLEVTLRLGRGTLAEVLGPDLLPVDRLSRRIGFNRRSVEQAEVLAPGMRSMVDAYVAGVTAGAAQGLRRRPHEFALLGIEPSPWAAADVLAFTKITSFLLATNWDNELARLKILAEDGPGALRDLDPTYPEWQPATMLVSGAAGRAFDGLVDALDSLETLVSLGGASNNWSLAASRTATGRPMLANDAHLSPALPPHWYLAHITTPGWSAAGATFVGAPSVPIGHNGFAAWGVTVGMTDNADFFIEQMGPDGRSVRQGDEFIPCEVRTELIRVKGRPDVTEEVLATPHGPIVGPALAGEVGALSLRAVWLDPLPLRGLLEMHLVRGFEQFREIFSAFPILPLNITYADESGTIGWQLVGQAPRRRRGYGAIPLPGWDPRNGWEPELVPHERMPYVVDPDSGFVSTANNKAVPDLPEGPSDPFLTVDWIEGYRAARLVEVLDSRRDWDLAGMTALQMDQASLPWREMRPLILDLSPADRDAQEAIALLRSWDGKVKADSAGAAVFELFVAEMSKRIAQARAPRGWRWALGLGFSALTPFNTFAVRRVGHLVKLLREQPASWFDRPWHDEIADTLAEVVRRLRADHGQDPAKWAWGHVRPLTLIHPFGRRKPFDRVFNLGPMPWGGDANTPGQAGVAPLDPTANPLVIASIRMVVDVGEWSNSRFVLPGGQSGNPFSPHYRDQLKLWRRGHGIPIPWSDAEVARSTTATLRLQPSV